MKTVNNLEDEITQTEYKITLLSRRLRELRLQRRRSENTDPDLVRLIRLIIDNPGCSHDIIAGYFSDLEANQLKQLVTKARRNRGLIENRGSRAQPLWYVTF